MQMNKPAANSLSTDYFNELREALEDIEKNPDAKGVIISSVSHPTLFYAFFILYVIS